MRRQGALLSPRLLEEHGVLPLPRDSGSIAQRMHLRAIITLAFARRIWLVATLLLAWTMPTRLAASAVDTVVCTRVALLVAPRAQDNAPLTNSSPNVTSRHNTPPLCAEAQRAEHRFGRGGGAEGAGGVGIPNDKTGNLYETGAGAETRVYAEGNRLIHEGNTQYAWDADGRMIEKRTVEPQPGLDAPKEEIWKYTWNGAGLMQKATRSDGLIVECAYDPFCDDLVDGIIADAKAGTHKTDGKTHYDKHAFSPGMVNGILANPDAVYETGSGSLVFRKCEDIVVVKGVGAGQGTVVTAYGPSGIKGESGATHLGGLPSDKGGPVTDAMIVTGTTPGYPSKGTQFR